MKAVTDLEVSMILKQINSLKGKVVDQSHSLSNEVDFIATVRHS